MLEKEQDNGERDGEKATVEENAAEAEPAAPEASLPAETGSVAETATSEGGEEKSAETVSQPETEGAKSDGKTTKNRKKTAWKIAGFCGFIFSLVLLAVFTVNAMLCVFVDHYYPTFGQYRLFAIVSDSMEPEIPTGNMIVGRVPRSEAEIEVGTVITYELTQGNSIVLITHRVIAINQNADGSVSYTTRGDNAGGTDAVRPAFSDVVGIYTGNRCGFFGYLFGFLQSAEGAIALIVILLIIVITWIIVRFVNLVTMWRRVALNALKTSGALLAGTQIEELGTIADVIGIVSKDPLDKKDIARKDKKLNWFIKTGSLPRRPYSDDLDETLLPNSAPAMPRLVNADNLPVREVVKEVVREKIVEVPAEASAALLPELEELAASETASPVTVRERHEAMRYTLSFQARIIQLKPQAKEWYSALKNELLSYRRVRVKEGKKFESFLFGKRTAARLALRGKTLCLQLALDPDLYENSKFTVERINGGTPCQYRIKSGLRARYARELIAELMKSLGTEKAENYEPQDFYKPYEGVVSLMEKGLAKRSITATERVYKIVEVTDE